MHKKLFVLAAITFWGIAAFSQTLFSYGNHQVDAGEFLRAFEKNNTSISANKKAAIKEYLDLYIRSRLKIQDAYDKRYDTLPQLQAEVSNLRQQIIGNYLNDPETFNELLKEAFERSQKDIHIAHIFISTRMPGRGIDSAVARQKAEEAMDLLRKGEDFSSVALAYSNDPAVAVNKGDMGFITVFTLPYELENLAYKTPPGKYSEIYHSRAGYHIFKVLGVRKALGKRKAKQILLAFPPEADDALKAEIGRRADSVYQAIKNGADFGKMATRFSNDYISASSGGNIADIKVGDYLPDYENYVFGLAEDGEVGKPFLTAHGYHIVKRIKGLPVVTDPYDKTNQLLLRGEVEQSDRMEISKSALNKKITDKAGFKLLPFNFSDLMALTESIIDLRSPAAPLIMNPSSALFTIGAKTFTAANWLEYAKTFRYKSDGTGIKPYAQVMDEYITNEIQQYYRDHLEEFNPDFRNQMTDFKEGNLFFEIMQQEVWNKAQADTLALHDYYEKHKSKYKWQKSADAVLFFCSDINVSDIAYEQLKKDPVQWRRIVEALGEKVVADSARYEWSQIPAKDKNAFNEGMVTAPVVNTADNTASFAYVVKLYPKTEPRSFNDARGLVINDFQNELEEKWVAGLKKKYPVKINSKVLKEISK